MTILVNFIKVNFLIEYFKTRRNSCCMKKGSNVVSDLDRTSDDDEVKVGAESDLLVRFETADSFIQGLSLRLGDVWQETVISSGGSHTINLKELGDNEDDER